MQETKHVVGVPAAGLAGESESSECKCEHPPGAAETDPGSHSSRPTARPCDLGRSPSQFDSDDQLLEICQSEVRVSWFKVRVCCLGVSCGRVSLIRLIRLIFL